MEYLGHIVGFGKIVNRLGENSVHKKLVASTSIKELQEFLSLLTIVTGLLGPLLI